MIRPKFSTGDIFPITSSQYDAHFRISTVRGGVDGTGVEPSATIGDNSVTCTITPSIGNSLVAGTPYLYDVSIEDSTDPNIIYTLLTGTINITGDIATGP